MTRSSLILVFVFKHLNIIVYVSCSSFLQKTLGTAVKLGPTATEQLIELFKAQHLNTTQDKLSNDTDKSSNQQDSCVQKA